MNLVNHFLNKNVLARIRLQEQKMKLEVLFSTNLVILQENVRKYNGPTDIQKIKIEILDDYGEVVNLLGADWGFVVTATMKLDNIKN